MSIFVCGTCGTTALKWSGKCESCGEWNTLKEQVGAVRAGKKGKATKAAIASGEGPKSFAQIAGTNEARFSTELPDVDRVLGGGFVSGMVVLLSGEPGIGKSTLLLQISQTLARGGKRVLYASGEESGAQVRLRAQRLGVDVKNEHLQFVHEQNVDVLHDYIADGNTDLLLLDSIQTAYTQEVTGEPGNVAQVRGAANRLIDAAKRSNTAVILVGHVTKGGTLAGPKTLEHLVDTVAHLEGDRSQAFRILRTVKNRFGSTDETGVFEMQSEGLVSVQNPSELFLAERQTGVEGSVVTATLEGSRTFLLEVQAIASKTAFGYPKRTSSGFDVNRLQLLLAVLTNRAGLRLDEKDVFFNVVGGVKVNEPSIDLAAALAVASSALQRPLLEKTVVVGEVGLTGEVRSVAQLERRIKEAEQLGFTSMIVPKGRRALPKTAMKLLSVRTLEEALRIGFSTQKATPRTRKKRSTTTTASSTTTP